MINEQEENAFEIKRGNTKVFNPLIRDKAGAIVSNLGAAVALKFEIKKEEKAATALITKTLGAGITINDPSTGYVKITLKPSETIVPAAGYYYLALEIRWSADVVYEVALKKNGIKTERVRFKEHITVA